jgi:methanogenic corrinoid protein MtbC1
VSSVKNPVQYPIRAAANRTGLSIDTLRAWERRYKAVIPTRSERGRSYGEGDIRRLLLLRDVVAHGHAIGQVASLGDRELQKLLAGPAKAAKAVGSDESANDGLQPVLAAIESFDYASANSHLGRLAVLLPTRNLVFEVVLPLMRVVGERWHDGKMTIAQEHMLSAILRNLLGGLVRLHSLSPRPSRILFATPSGEQHEFGILASAMLAVASGFEAVYLGTSLPALEVVSVAKRTSPLAVVLGIKASEPSAETLEELRLVAEKLPRSAELWVGGSEVKKTLRSLRGARVFALESFDELDTRLDRLQMAGL